ncbi:ATP-dependent RNA helicase DHX30-like [Ptychodera flava]|uniref:ATP-dependent RNA helicase DHX30-like n=1 Tax=Ptychodera flava TaxID=63121 RepID=UPI00396A7CA7
MGRRKSEAEKLAAALACAKLKEFGVLDHKHRPVMPEYGVYSQQDIREFIRKETLPTWVKLDTELQEDIASYLEKWRTHSVSSDITQENFSAIYDGNETGPFQENERDNFILKDEEMANGLNDVFTGKPYYELSEEQLMWRNSVLEDRLRFIEGNTDPRLLKIRNSVNVLPVTTMRSDIFSIIENNQVVVLEGDTGCGKTTQVPQIILDEYIRQGRGTDCNIVVTQPRRISAISIADRVSQERGERLGQTAGYQVRLESKVPREHGRILFCTVGILLKKMQGNQSLEGVSHVVVDEVHERDVNTDFLLILLKDLIKTNPEIKIILMSASINTQMFSRYFNNCPIISVPGLMYPVKEYFLEDVSRMTTGNSSGRWNGRSHGSSRNGYSRPDTDWDLVANTVDFIDSTKPHGAILCFLPGWQDIMAVKNKLQEMWSDESNHWIFPVHSSVPVSQQQAIFERAPDHVRKVVLATNIAETSITINDVVYVVNAGNHKELSYNVETGTSCLDLHWISRASIRQRRGRAGRCQPGECYHLFTREQFNQMDEYQVAEMLRVPLEQLVVETKVHTPGTMAEDFLSKALEPPSAEAVEKAVELLEELDILDESENLTALGHKLCHITTDPRLAKAIVYSAIFRCVDPVLTITASLSSRDPYMDSMENRSEVSKIRQHFADGSRSDHISQLNAFNTWQRYAEISRQDGWSFARQKYLHHGSLSFIRGLRRQFSDNLYDAGMVYYQQSGLSFDDICNSHSGDRQLITGVLAAALYPNIVYIRRGEIINDKLKMKNVTCKDLDNNRVLIHSRSLNSDETVFAHRWLVYFTKTRSTATFIRDSSMVHPLAIICLAGKSISVLPVKQGEARYFEERQLDQHSGPAVKLVLDGNDKLAFFVTAREAELLLDLVEEIDKMIMECLSVDEISHLTQRQDEQHTELLELVRKLVNMEQEPYIQGERTEERITSASEVQDLQENRNLWNPKWW